MSLVFTDVPCNRSVKSYYLSNLPSPCLVSSRFALSLPASPFHKHPVPKSACPCEHQILLPVNSPVLQLPVATLKICIHLLVPPLLCKEKNDLITCYLQREIIIRTWTQLVASPLFQIQILHTAPVNKNSYLYVFLILVSLMRLDIMLQM